MPRLPVTRARPYTPRKGAFAGRTFHTEREYRNALAKRKGFASWAQQQRSRPAATSPRAVKRLSKSEQASRKRALGVVSKMRREGLSLTRAANLEKTTPNTVRRHVGAAIEKDGRIARARAGDRLARVMNVVTSGQGVEPVVVGGSRQASVVSNHWRAIARYLNTGDDSDPARFYGVTVSGFELETDLDAIDYLASIGELDDVEDIYDLAA